MLRIYKEKLSKEDFDLLCTEGVCENCGAKGTWQVDPYAEDIYGEYNLVCVCDDCYQRYADDI